MVTRTPQGAGYDMLCQWRSASYNMGYLTINYSGGHEEVSRSLHFTSLPR
jgi:hypothetical protein